MTETVVKYFARITDRSSEGKCSLNETLSNKPYCLNSIFGGISEEEAKGLGLFEITFRGMTKELQHLAKQNIIPHGDISAILASVIPQLVPALLQYDLAKAKEAWEIAILEKEMLTKEKMLEEQEWKTKIAQAQTDPTPIKPNSVIAKTRDLTCEQAKALKGELALKLTQEKIGQKQFYANLINSWYVAYAQIAPDPVTIEQQYIGAQNTSGSIRTKIPNWFGDYITTTLPQD